MIDKFWDTVFYFLDGAVSLLPAYTPDHPDSMGGFIGMLSGINQFFPVVELTECVSAYLIFIALLAAAKPILKLAHIS